MLLEAGRQYYPPTHSGQRSRGTLSVKNNFSSSDDFQRRNRKLGLAIHAKQTPRALDQKISGTTVAKGRQTSRCVLVDPELPSPAPEILDYLARHPDAKDTLDGIYWWILDACIREWCPKIAATVAQLVEADLLIREAAAGGKLFYSISPRYRAALARQVPLEN